MKTPLLIILAFLVLAFQSVSGQDAVKKRIPIMVSHLPEGNRAILRRKEAPKHTIFSKVICFKKKCRSYLGWQHKQKKRRFKGYKDGGKVPRPSRPKSVMPVTKPVAPVIVNDSVITASSPIIIETVNFQDQVFVLDEVLFELNSAHLNERFTFRLDSLVELLTSHSNLNVQITGHTDNTGRETHNVKLSRDRAAAVADYLVKNNIDTSRITFEGAGSARPVSSNETEEGRRKNRRVEILLSEN